MVPTPRPDVYAQRLPALGLAIERNTPSVPSDGYFYVMRDSAELGRFRSLKAAKARWDAEIANSGWKPAEGRSLTPAEMLARDKAARERQEKAEHWDRVSRRR
jgi:hypothetical protein